LGMQTIKKTVFPTNKVTASKKSINSNCLESRNN
jgi:hypothetical protein